MFVKQVRKGSTVFMSRAAIVFLAVLFLVLMGPGLLNTNLSRAAGDDGEWSNFCSQTAWVAFKACNNEALDDFWIGVGNCKNLFDEDARDECAEEVKAGLDEARQECRDQREGRLEVCEDLGEDRYDPQLNPADFVDFEAVLGGEAFTPNPYFPLVPGIVWKYRTIANGEVIERIKVEVLEETKEILGINCIVVRDRVWEIDGGERTLVEDTFDWYAQENDGTVWYMGEIAQEFEDGELVGIEGSWKAGRDFAKPGILMEANPVEGDIYRQEFALGDAEDLAEVISRGEASVNVPYGNWGKGDDVLQTKDFTPIEPDVFEYKFYVPQVGCVLEENPETGERVELVKMITP